MSVAKTNCSLHKHVYIVLTRISYHVEMRVVAFAQPDTCKQPTLYTDLSASVALVSVVLEEVALDSLSSVE
jgi:hypothetical protein